MTYTEIYTNPFDYFAGLGKIKKVKHKGSDHYIVPKDFEELIRDFYEQLRTKKDWSFPAENLEQILAPFASVKEVDEELSDYFGSGGEEFEEYLKSLGRDVAQITYSGIGELGEHKYATVLRNDKEAKLIFDKKGIDYAANQISAAYGVSRAAAKQYLFMHEHTHLSQDLNHSTKYLEEDVERTIAEYSNMKASAGNEVEARLYSDIGRISSQRIYEVDFNYAAA